MKKFSEYLQEIEGILLAVEVPPFVLESSEITVLSKEEISLLYQSAEEEHPTLKWRDIVMLDLYYGCGLRRSEGVKLNVKDVNLHKNHIHVRWGKRL